MNKISIGYGILALRKFVRFALSSWRPQRILVEKRSWTLLAIALAKGDSLTPVQLQKAIFLFGKLMPTFIDSAEYYRFSAYNYGPFCLGIYEDAKELKTSGLVEIRQYASQAYPEYIATEVGINAASSLKREIPSQALEHAQQIVDWVRSQSFSTLVTAIYERYPEYRENSIFKGVK